MKGRLGIRARIVAVFSAWAILAAASLWFIFRPLVLSNIEYLECREVLAMGRIAAAIAPRDAREWPGWLERLQNSMPDAAVRLVAAPPGTPEFSRECEVAGIETSDAMTAYAGGLYCHPQPPASLVALRAQDGSRVLLVLRASDQRMPHASALQTLWFLALVLSFLFAGAGAYVIAYRLLVRPVVAAAGSVHRALWTGPGAAAADLDSLPRDIAALVRAEQEAHRRADRLAIELRRIREDLKGAQATLLRAEKLASVGQMAAGIAHEIGNPIGIIVGLADVMKSGPTSPEESRKFAAQIHEAAERVDRIIRDLLQFARPQKDEEARADVRDVLESTIQLLRPQKRFKDVEVQREVAEGPLVAEIRSSQLQQVLVNLLLNAADAMNGRGRVTVRVYRRDRDVILEVEDQGPGVPPQDRDRIFDPFYTTKPPGEGTGLGLPICAQIVEVYGGEITVDRARQGPGACFRVRLWQAN